MPHYKLTYFNGRALGEPARQMLHLAKVSFEDVRVFRDDGSWERVKPHLPFGKLPVLEVDGFEIPESGAIGRYLAKQFGFYGQNDKEAAWIDAIVDQYKDFFPLLAATHVARRDSKPEAEQLRIRAEVTAPAVSIYLTSIRKLLAKSESGFLVGSKVSWADLVVADTLTSIERFGFYNATHERLLEVYRAQVNATEGLKEWLEKRPHSDI